MKNKKILIIGERFAKNIKNAVPLKDGQTARRLRKWFDKKNYENMIKIADIINAIPNYNNRDVLMNYIKERNYRLIFLLGRVAQNILFRKVKNDIIIIACDERSFMLLPHPSGRNYSCNHKDKIITETVRRTINAIKS